ATVEVGVFGRGIARASKMREGVDPAEPTQPRVAPRIPGAAVERIASVSADAQRVSAVPVAEVVAKAETLEARVKTGRCVAERAEAVCARVAASEVDLAALGPGDRARGRTGGYVVAGHDGRNGHTQPCQCQDESGQSTLIRAGQGHGPTPSPCENP